MKNATTDIPMIYGMPLGGQPVVKKGRYADHVWNKKTYPKYVSGGGFVMNWKIAMLKISQKLNVMATSI